MKIRRRGYAINNQELVVGLRAVAAPIMGEHGEVVAAINISGTTETISRSRLRHELAPLVVETAEEISQTLGHLDENSVDL